MSLAQRSIKAVHLTSVHHPQDPRIFQKQCRSLSAAGLEVVLIAPGEADDCVSGVRIRSVPRHRSRVRRWTGTVAAVLRAALEERGDVYHIHDPELLPVGVLLRMRGVPVVYDVHEDYITAIRQKAYIPRFLRSALARAVGACERLAAAGLEVVIAERYYAERFTRSVPVLNYPVLDDWLGSDALFGPVPRLLYTGSITPDRGAFHYARLSRLLPDFEVHLVGRVGRGLHEALRREAGSASGRLVVPFVDRFVPPADILAYCRERSWLAGLAVFPPTPHYQRKELTKFFEYMAMGLPVVASGFPTWRELIERAGAGILVDPDRLEDAADSISDLLRRPSAGEALGAAGRDAVRHRYDWRSQAKVLVELYERLGAAGRARRGASR